MKNRKIIMLIMQLYRGGHKRAAYLKKKNIFAEMGEKCYWFPRVLPADPSNLMLHNNVNIATGVYFCEHDVIHHMLNNCEEYLSLLKEKERYSYSSSNIEIMDNVFIGAHAIIMGGIKIGPNAIIAAGSVVVKDVSPNTVVGVNPASVICSMDDYINRRKELQIID